ncbi:hypothetical protein EQ845_01790 [Pseudomonas putida]|nr:hypothetical protein DBL05_14235 [Pseudomonas putida]TRO38982.1 hypothetical protein EQ845_01790 [Pseudomonas putida]
MQGCLCNIAWLEIRAGFFAGKPAPTGSAHSLGTAQAPVGLPAKGPDQPSRSFRPCNSCSVTATPSSSATSRSR